MRKAVSRSAVTGWGFSGTIGSWFTVRIRSGGGLKLECAAEGCSGFSEEAGMSLGIGFAGKGIYPAQWGLA